MFSPLKYLCACYLMLFVLLLTLPPSKSVSTRRNSDSGHSKNYRRKFVSHAVSDSDKLRQLDFKSNYFSIPRSSKRVERSTNITIAVLAPQNESLPYSLHKILPAIIHGVYSLENNPSFASLANRSFNIIHQDTACSSTHGPLAAFDFADIADVFLGPLCPYVLAPVARYSPVWNVSLSHSM